MINNVIHPKTKNEYWSSGCGLFCLIFRDRAQVEAIHHAGQCYDDVKQGIGYFRDGDQFGAYPDDMIRRFLISCGYEMTGPDGVNNMTRDDLEISLLWLAAGDLVDTFDNAANNGY